jgi:TRAP transporter TAXI family solute receptor
MMKKRWLLSLVMLTLLISSLISITGAENIDRIRFTSQEVGSALLMYTTTITELAKAYFPKDFKFDILPYGSVVASCTLVNDKKAEFGWGDVSAKWAYEGQILYDKPHANLASVAGGLQQANLQIFATKSFLAKTGLKTLNDIRKKKLAVRIVTKKKGSLGQSGAGLQLEAYGITYDDIRAWGGSITETGVSDIVDMMRDNRADIWFDNLAPGHPAATELFQTAEVMVIANTPKAIKYLEKYGYVPVKVKAGTWKRQTADIVQPQGATVIICRKDLPNEIVYNMTKTICENAQKLRDSHAQLSVFDEKTAWSAKKVLIPLHPGAIQYYKEKGWMK